MGTRVSLQEVSQDWDSRFIRPHGLSTLQPAMASPREAIEEFLWVPTAFTAQSSVASVNRSAARGLEAIQHAKEVIPGQRKELNEVMNARMAELAPLCSKYMFRRAELQGLSAAQCLAAQGRLNAEQLTDDGGPPGCVDLRQTKSQGDPRLPGKTCTWGYGKHKLKCSARWSVQMCSRGSIPIGSTSTSDPLDYLRDREAVPGSDPDGEALSMDDWVRRWCHPKFSVPARALNADLAAGQHVSNEEAELEAEALKPAGDNPDKAAELAVEK
ncbi:unnamed protein product [Durusdinium trenchii]|uniref:Uncharacterized protein n=1 Tax=Durusdinium trenchii TaxID=1381693 RepID=A0ABP0I5I3_9DINO